MNPLDIVLAGLFEMLGFSGGQSPDAPKLDGSERFDAKGQTKMTNAKGNLRDFTSPRQSANRMPSLDPLTNRSNLQAIPPNRPPGGFGQSPGQLNLYGQTAGTPALPPAGQTGGSLPPSGTTVPTTSRPRPEQGPQTRRQMAQAKLDQAAKGTRGGSTITPKAGAATAADARGTAIKNAVRKGGGMAADVAGPALQILDAVLSFQGAKEKGADNQQAMRTSAGSVAGGAAGFQLGMKAPGGPKVKLASALILGLIGQTMGESALENIQGYNKGETTKAEPKAEAEPETQTAAPQAAAPEDAYPATGRLLDTPELRKQLAREIMTPIQKPLTNPSKAPIRAQLRSRPNLGLEQVTPRDALRPDLYAY